MSLRTSRSTAVVLVTMATFTDIVAYSVCVPVLPDLARRLGAGPTAIGLLFASFGVTLLAVAVPLGSASDRIGRRLPLVAGLLTLSAATVVFAFARSLPALIAARMIQGAADGATWVVGFALVADLYGPDERGRVMGYVMSGTSVAVVVGPTLGGWLYQAGGLALPFLVVSGAAAVCAVGFWLTQPGTVPAAAAGPTVWSVIRVPTVAVCSAFVLLTGATMAMLEPVLPLFFNQRLGSSPADIGFLFGGAAIASALAPFVYGPLTDRWGGRALTPIGLLATALWLPILAIVVGFWTAFAAIVLVWAAMALILTPSLAYMADVTAFAGKDAYGIGFGVYNTAWAVGILAGPALSGWLFARVGFGVLILSWSLALVVITLGLVAIDRTVRSSSVSHQS
jgi:multidrug resistance protein